MASTYLTQTQTSGNRRTFTVSLWFKKSNLSQHGVLFDAYPDSSSDFYIWLWNDDGLYINQEVAGSGVWSLFTNRRFRDVNAWYHLVLAVDTTQATSSDRLKLYINGVQETSFSIETYPSLNYDSVVNNGNQLRIGARGSNQHYFSGSMAHYHFIDGTAYDASYFGSTDATTGIWKPNTSPSVTYGTNGFFLKFANSGSMGTDSSGNGNNFSVGAGTLTQTQDTPSNVFCTINPLSKGSVVTLSNGNTTITNGATWASAMATLAATKGKYYWENKVSSLGTVNCGITKTTQDGTTHSSVDAGRIMYSSNGNVYTEGFSNVPDYSTGTTFTTNDIIGVALDLTNGTIKFYKNNTLIQTVTDSDISAYELTPAWGMNSGTFNVNFGNGYFGTTAVSSAESDGNGLGLFEYAPPTGYYALCTKSINSQEYS